MLVYVYYLSIGIVEVGVYLVCFIYEFVIYFERRRRKLLCIFMIENILDL